MIYEGNAWKNRRIMWDGSHILSAEQLLKVSSSFEFWGGRRFWRVQKPRKMFTVPEGNAFSICLCLGTI